MSRITYSSLLVQMPPLLLLVLVAVVQAQLYVGFPINEQLPDVARVGQEYSFTFSSQTYKSWSGGSISYSASDFPSWMSFDSGSRTFTGTPSHDDVGQFSVTVDGVDSADQSLILTQYNMIVSNDTGLHLRAPDAMFVQISKYGQTNGKDGLVLKQGDKFDITFGKDIFESYENSTRKIVACYGRSLDRSSLPNWIYFDGDSCSFSGTVPYVTLTVAPSLDYSFAFIGSDYYGYTGAEGIFQIVVGAHQLSTSVNETIKVNGTLNSTFDVELPISQVYLDGNVIAEQNISQVSADNLPDFISLNTNNYSLTGRFPDSQTFDNFTISIKDVYENVVELPYSFDALGSVFTVLLLPNVNATKGKWFQYQLLDSYFTDVNHTTVDASFSGASWLSYHKDNKTFTGMAPRDMSSVNVDIDASSLFDSETKSFSVRGQDASPSSSSSSTSALSTATSSSTASGSGAATATLTATSHNKHSSNNKKLAIGLGVGIPLACILACLVVFLCCVRRRRSTKDSENTADAVPTTDAAVVGGGAAGAAAAAGLVGATRGEDKLAADISAMALEEKTDDEGEVAEKDKGDISEVYSTSSSVTHVDGGEALYYDAEEKPMKSWRANDQSDRAAVHRESEISMSTVNTDNLFLVRLVDDKSVRDLGVSESLGSRNFLSNNSLDDLMTRSLLGNVQRLDSEGNVVGIVHSKNLDAVTEENSREYSGTQHEVLGGFETYRFNDETDTSSYDLLQKFGESRNPLQSNSEQDFSNYDLQGAPIGDFHATKDRDGEFKWSEGNFSMNLANTSNAHLVTPVRENFYEERTPQTLAASSVVSVHSTSSDIVDRLRLDTSLTSKAKLMDFTRKGSLRELVHEHDFDFNGETAIIHH